MAELLVRIQDRKGFDPILNALALRPGDVVAVCPDDWKWTPAEIENPDWRIIKMPGLDVEALGDLLIPAHTSTPDSELLAKRAVKLDLTNIAIAPLLDKPGEAIIIDSVKQPDILALKVAKPLGAVTIG